MPHHNRLYRYGTFEPVVDAGEHIKLLGPRPGFFQVEYVEPIPFIESESNRPGIRLRDFNANNLADGGRVSVTPAELQMGKHELLQFRWTVFETSSGVGLISAIAGVDFNEINIEVAQLAANRRWVTQSAGGILNAALLLPLASAEEAAWSLGTLITATANINRLQPLPWPQLNLTELFVWEIDGPTFNIVNRSGAALTQGELRIAAAGFRFVCSEVDDLEARGAPFTRIPVQGMGQTPAR